MDKMGRKGFFGKFAALFSGIALFNSDNRTLEAASLKPNQYKEIETAKGVLSEGNSIKVDALDDGIHISADIVENPYSFFDSVNIDLLKIHHDDNGNSCQFRLKALGMKVNDKITINIDGTDVHGQKLTEECTLTNDCPTYDTAFYYSVCTASIKPTME